MSLENTLGLTKMHFQYFISIFIELFQWGLTAYNPQSSSSNNMTFIVYWHKNIFPMTVSWVSIRVEPLYYLSLSVSVNEDVLHFGGSEF
jgi:hypothetical protein